MAGVDIQMDEFGHNDFVDDTAPLLPTTDDTSFDTFTPPATTSRGDNVGAAETSFGGDNTEIDTYGNPMYFPDDTGGGDNADDTGGGDNADVAGTSFGNDNTGIGTHGDDIDLPDTPMDEPGMIAGDNIENLRDILNYGPLEEAKIRVVDEFFNSIKEEYFELKQFPEKFPYDQFTVVEERGIRNVYWTPEQGGKISIINRKGGGFLALSTLASKYGHGGTNAIRESMGLKDYNHKTKRLSPEARENLKQARANLPEGSEEITPAVADRSIKSAQKIIAVLTSEGYIPRDIIDMCKSLERSRGELINNLAKLLELDEHIALEKRKLEEAPDEAAKDRIAKRLRDLQNQRAPRLEAASATREALRSQFSRIRETLHRILHEDKTLAERIKTLFREQGITIASVLTAIGMIISTIVLAIPGGGAAAPPQPPQPPGKGGAKEWIKKQLQSLGRILAKLAGKAAAALRGIIGSIVSWLLSLLGKTAVWLAGNLWAVLLAVGGLLLVAAREWLLPKKPKQS